jgi:quercetin dioxygenase-like cupin family protein
LTLFVSLVMISVNRLAEKEFMVKSDYAKYLVTKPVYEAFGGVKNRQSPAMTIMSNKQVPESNHYIEVGWVYGIPQPNPSLSEHVHNHDEIIIYWSSSFKTPQSLGAEIEFYVGGQPITFNTTSSFYIPKGTPHGPVIWKQFTSPHVQMAMMLGTGSAPPEWSGKVPGKVSPVKKNDFEYEQYAIRSPMREAGAEFIKGRTAPTMTYMSGVQIPGVKYYIEFGWTFDMPMTKTAGKGMPEMVHKNFDEIVLHIGGDPTDPEDLGGEVEFYVGGQPLTIDTTSALFIPRGLNHGPLRLKEYRKPHIVMAIMCGAGTVKEGWEGSFMPAKEDKAKK